MVFRRLTGLAPHELEKGRFGIPEPPPRCPELTPSQLENALILVPALAFDDRGYRLGYGGGYYDRYLGFLRDKGISVTTVGLAYGICRAKLLPHEPHDLAVDIIIDERRTVLTHG